MIYRFNTKQTYVSKVQLQHFERFLEIEPKVGYIYTNSNGESRCVIRVSYPSGVIMKATIYSESLRDHSRNYHTPLAKAPNGLSEIKWLDEANHIHSSTSQEWMIWVDEKTTAKEKETGRILDMKEVALAMSRSKKSEAKTVEEREALEQAMKQKSLKPLLAKNLEVKKRGRPPKR